MGFSCQLHMPTSPLEFLNFDINTFGAFLYSKIYSSYFNSSTLNKSFNNEISRCQN